MKIAFALGIMLAINVFLFLGQVSIDDIASSINRTSGTTLYNYDNSLMQEYDSGDYVLTSDTALPDTEGGISPETGNFFVDPIGSLKSFFGKVGTGFSYFKSIVNAVPNFLKSIGLPNELSFALGFFWHVLTLFLIIMLIWGRQL
jgi:hypothetical protein